MKKAQSIKKASIMLVAATSLAFAAASCGSRGGTASEPVLSNRSDGTDRVAASTEAPAAGNTEGNDGLIANTGSAGASCEAVVGKLSEFMRGMMESQLPADKTELAARMQRRISEVMLVSCNEGEWPDAVKTCIMEARDEKAMDECGDKGGQEFENKLRKRMQPVMEEIAKEMAAADDTLPAGNGQPDTGEDEKAED